jgi:hypothetical protein
MPDATPKAPDDSWIKWAALSTTILAVCAAISSLKGGGYSTRVQLLTTKETNAWSYFQSKSIKQHVLECHRQILTIERAKTESPAVRATIDRMLKSADADIIRYDAEKKKIQAEAEALSADQGDLKRHGAAFGLAVMFCQIAIMLSAVGSLMKRRYAWQMGLVIGAFGVLYFLNGFLLVF